MEKIYDLKNRKKKEINKIIQILVSENFVDKETAKMVKNKILSTYYSNFFDEKKGDSKDVLKELYKIDAKISNTVKKIKDIKEKILYIKLDEKTNFLGLNRIHNKKFIKNYKTMVVNKAKTKFTKKLFGNIIDSIANINYGNNADERKKLLKIYRKLKQENNQLKNIRNELIQRHTDNTMFIQNKIKQKTTLRDYINKKSEGGINTVLNWIDSVDLRESDSQKEDLKKIILDSYQKMGQSRHNDEIFKMAKSLESYINENFENIMKNLDGIQKSIIELEVKKEKIREEEKSGKIEDVIGLKEEEYKIQLEITKLKKEYDEIKYNINEKLKAYDGSTYEEKKAEFLNNNKKDGE